MIVDASVWVSSLLPGDPHHRAAREWLGAQLKAGVELIVPAHGLSEVAGALARRTGRPDRGRAAVQALREVSALRVVEIDRDLGNASAGVAADLRLRGADAIYAATAHQLDLPLVTLDSELHQRAGSYIRVLYP